jgi:uncharacterized protein
LAGEIRSLMLQGPVGRLEALLNEGRPGATHAALVCHPHPMFGGTMHNKVVYNVMKSLSGFGFSVLRFNFRGAGLSEGQHDQGRGEVNDVRAALDFLAAETQLPIIFAGFSFGAAVGLRAACIDDRVVGLISLGTPVAVDGRTYTYDFLRDCKLPKLFVSGGSDQYSPLPDLKAAVGNAADPKKLVIVDDADHFFLNKLPRMQQAVEEWLQLTFNLAAPDK